MSDYFIGGCVLAAFMFLFGGIGYIVWHDTESRKCEAGYVYVDEKAMRGCVAWEVANGGRQ